MLVLLLVPGLRLMLILLVMLILMVLLLLPMLLCVRRMLLLLLHATAAAIRSGIPSVSATALVIHVLLELWAWTQPVAS